MSNPSNSRDQWDIVLHPKTGWFNLQLKDLWRYRYLTTLFVRRDFVTFYQQTILGPLWYLLQPLLMTVVFAAVFGKVVQIPTDGIPMFLFYFSGTILWSYFSSCFTQTAGTFLRNAGMFGMVYFPRLTVPISTVIVNLLQFALQFIFFLGFYFYFAVRGASIHPASAVVWLPVLILQMALLGFGMGLMVASVTTKYRDLIFVMGFGMQLWMFATPIIYPASLVDEAYRGLYMLNPLVSIVETFRLGFLGQGTVELRYIVSSWCITLVVLASGMVLFNRAEKTVMDSI